VAPVRANAPPADHARSLRRNFGIRERDAMSAAGTNAAADADRQTAMGISRPGDGTVIFFSQFATRPAAV
jgi:hypothetical protein